MTDVHFVDFIKVTLKSKDDFSAAFDIVLSTNLTEYLKRFLIFQPGDWPAQLYIGRLSTKHCKNTAAPPILLSA